MPKPPYMPFYVDDFEADTAHLTFEEDGVYNRLLRLCWRTSGCSVPDDPQWIARRLRCSIEDYHRLVLPLIREFFLVENGRVFQPRQKREWQKANDVSRKRSEAGRKGGRPRNPLPENEKSKSRAKANKKLGASIQNHTNITPLTPHSGGNADTVFEEFWAVFPKKVAKPKTRDILRRILKRGDATPEQLVGGARRYAAEVAKRQPAADGRVPMAHPTTWLNQGRWLDEDESAASPTPTVSLTPEQREHYEHLRQERQRELEKERYG